MNLAFFLLVALLIPEPVLISAGPCGTVPCQVYGWVMDRYTGLAIGNVTVRVWSTELSLDMVLQTSDNVSRGYYNTRAVLVWYGGENITSGIVNEGELGYRGNATKTTSSTKGTLRIDINATDFWAPQYSDVTFGAVDVYAYAPFNITSTWTDNSGVINVFARHNASGNWSDYAVVKVNNTYVYAFNASVLTPRKVIGWKLVGNDSAGNLNDTMQVQTFEVKYETSFLTFALNWNLFSIPLVPI